MPRYDAPTATAVPCPSSVTDRDLALDATLALDEQLDVFAEAGALAVPEFARLAWETQVAELRACFARSRKLLARLARREAEAA